MASMAALLKPSSFSYGRNQSINGRSIITPPPVTPTRISFPFNRRLVFTPLTQTPLPKITTTTTTKCSNINSSSSSKGSTFMEEKEKEKEKEKLKQALMKAMLKFVKRLEKPALTAVLVWVLLTTNPIIAYSYSSRTAFFWGVWFVYDVYKAIATRRRIGDDGSIRFSLGTVLGSTVLLFCGLIMALMVAIVVVSINVFIGIVLFICGLAAVILLLMVVFIGLVFGFGKVTWPLVTKDESVNATDEHKKKKSAKVQVYE